MPVKPHGLSPRQWEVAQLVASGLTNKETASELFVETSTIDSHVHEILALLGFRRRAQIGAWVANEVLKDQQKGGSNGSPGGRPCRALG